MSKFLSFNPIKFIPAICIAMLLLGLGLLLLPAQPARADGPVINLGDLPPGKVVTLTFRASITTSLSPGTTQVCNQATISGTNFTSIVTNDPTTPAANDPTCTPIDLPSVTVVTGTIPSESGPTNGSFTINLDNPAPGGGLTINYNLSGSTASNPADYGLAAGSNISNLTGSSFLLAAGQSSGVITIIPVDDQIDDDGETVRLSLSGGSGYTLGATTVATQTILDNDTRNVTLLQSGGSTSVTEGGSTDTYTIQLDTIPTATVTISFNTGGQINPITNLTFPADVTALNPQTVTVVATDDALVEGDHTGLITHTISGGDYAGQSSPNVTANITDNDIAYTLAANNPTVNPEGNTGATPISFTLTRSGDITRNSTIDFNLSGTATNGVDYNNVSPVGGVISFAASVTQTTITMDVLGDFIDEANETITVTLTNPTGTNASGTGLISGSANAATTIIDDDSASVVVTPTTLTLSEPNGSDAFNIRLTSQPTATVTIGLSTGSDECTFPASVNLTDLNWDVGVTVTVTAVDDQISDGPQSCLIVTAPTSSSDPVYNNTFNPSDVNVTVNDDDIRGVNVSATSVNVTEGGNTAQYNVRLNTIPTATVTISVATGGQVNPVANLTFAADLTALDPQTVTVSATDDIVVEGDHNQLITHSASGGGYTGVSIPTITANITDNDIAYNLIADVPSVIEGDTGATPISFSLTRSGDITRTSSVNYSLSGSATNGVDYSNVSPIGGTINFGAGETQTTITLDVLGDFIVESDETITVTLSGATGTGGGGTATVSGSPDGVTILDDDSADITVSPTTPISISEPAGSDTFNVSLTSQPTATVVISLTTSTGECSLSANAVSLDSLNWQAGVTTTVTAIDDFVTDGTQPCNAITSAASSTDPNYNGLDPVDVAVNVLDDDVPGFTIAPTSGLTTTEAGGTASFSVRLRTQPTASVTITLASANITEGIPNLASLTFTTLNWNSPQTVTVTGQNDDVDDGDIAYTVVLSSATSSDGVYNGLNPDDVSLTNLDDDTAGFNISTISGPTSEDGITATLTIRLTSQPLATVTIPLSSSDTTEGTVSPASLSFTTLDWNVPQTVTITGVDDPDQDGDIIYNIQVGPSSSSDPLYNNGTAPTLVVTNLDNESPPSAPAGPLYLPLIVKNFVPAPDLVIDSLSASSSGVTLVIRNAGTAPVVDAFWVDVYFNPTVTPRLNQRWQDIAGHGQVWGITGAGLSQLTPGGTLTLTSGGAYFFSGESSSLPLPVGATVYGQVDSINFSTTYGAVRESNEANNLFGPVLSIATGNPPSAEQVEPLSGDGLPDR